MNMYTYYPYVSSMRASQSIHIRQNQAYAKLINSSLAPHLQGIVLFFNHPYGTEVYAEVTGLPNYQPATKKSPQIGPHGFHIHEFGDCSIGNKQDPFQASGRHWNPTKQPHGNHAGDFPVLFSNNGYSQMRFFTNKFKINDIIGKSIIIHQGPDDYKSQPAGNAGKRLACGVIQPLM